MRTVTGTAPPDKHRPGKFSPRSSSPPTGPDPGLDALLADPALSCTAKLVAAALARHWAWGLKSLCWPADRSIAARIGRSVGQVQRGLRELESVGLLRREKTAETPTGRRLVLLWRVAGVSVGAQPDCSSARSGPCASARSKDRNREAGTEPENSDPPPRPRPEPIAEPTTVEPVESVMAAPSVAPSPAPVESPPTVEALPLIDLATIGRPAAPAPLPLLNARPQILGPDPAPAPAPARRRGLSLSRSELAALVAQTGDPILAAELTRATAPPPPAEPAPQTLATAALLAKLPGRHDLTSVATERLCQDLGDFKPATWAFCRKAVEGVVTRAVLPSVLLDCHRQATGGKARDRGRVFVVAWKREGRLVN
jgi:hypothetical protein